MNSRKNAKMTVARILLIVFALIFVPLQLYFALKPGGAMELYTLSETFSVWFDLSMRDPVTAGGFIDLMVMMATSAVLIIAGVPAGRWRIPATAGLLVILAVYPALALILFLLLFWRRPDQFSRTEPA